MVNMVGEYNKYYVSTYLRIPEWESIMYVADVEGPRGDDVKEEQCSFFGSLYTKDGPKEAQRVGGDMIDFSLPEFGCINLTLGRKTQRMTNGVVYITRKPCRQWKRATTHKNTFTEYPISVNEIFMQMMPPSPFKNYSIWNMFYPEYTGSVRDSLERIESGDWLSHAFTNKFWLGVHPHIEGVVVGYKMHKVGIVSSYNPLQVCLWREYSPLYEELSEYVAVDMEVGDAA